MNYSDIEHFSNMAAGCESLRGGDVKSPDAVYAFTVLKLHASDAGLIAGQEGFLDNVKAGAQKTGEWIKKLFEAIKQWFATTFKSTRSKFKSAFSGSDEEKQKKLQAIKSGMISKVKAVQAGASSAPEEVDAKEIGTTGDKVIEALENGVPAGVASAVDSFLTAIDKVETKFIKYVSSKAPKGQEAHTEYQKAVTAFKTFSTPLNGLNVFIDSLSEKK